MARVSSNIVPPFFLPSHQQNISLINNRPQILQIGFHSTRSINTIILYHCNHIELPLVLTGFGITNSVFCTVMAFPGTFRTDTQVHCPANPLPFLTDMLIYDQPAPMPEIAIQVLLLLGICLWLYLLGWDPLVFDLALDLRKSSSLRLGHDFPCSGDLRMCFNHLFSTFGKLNNFVKLHVLNVEGFTEM